MAAVQSNIPPKIKELLDKYPMFKKEYEMVVDDEKNESDDVPIYRNLMNTLLIDYNLANNDAFIEDMQHCEWNWNFRDFLSILQKWQDILKEEWKNKDPSYNVNIIKLLGKRNNNGVAGQRNGGGRRKKRATRKRRATKSRKHRR